MIKKVWSSTQVGTSEKYNELVIQLALTTDLKELNIYAMHEKYEVGMTPG